MLSRRFLTTSTHPRAKLVGHALSISPDFARTAPPPPPVPSTSSPRSSRSPPAPPPNASSPITLKPLPRRPSPVENPSRPAQVAPDVSLAWRLANRAARRSESPAPAPVSQKAWEEDHEARAAVQLDEFLLRTLGQLAAEQVGGGGSARVGLVPLQELVKQKADRTNAVLDPSVGGLDYEPTPAPARRVRLDGQSGPVVETERMEEEQDGTVVVAHVMGGESPQVSVCSGFAVGKVGEGEGQMVLTCAHTLDGMERFLTPASSSSSPSATFILTPSGHVYTCTSILSSLPRSDLLLLRLSTTPINPSTLPVRRLRSLPVSPYPLPSGGGVSVHRYLNPLGRLRRKLQKLPEREWLEGRIVEYKDSRGRTAETGTYDELGTLWTTATPTPGSSGGPVVCKETGSVVGVTRGSSHQYGDKQGYGFATPAEKILEMFSIPGFKTTAMREAERAAKAATAAASAGATPASPPAQPAAPVEEARIAFGSGK
ncbi:hypothetical protein JCM8097_002189 [Rhodosporidiobolus ruineniae]